MGTEASGGSTSLDLSIRDDDLILCRSYGARGSHKEIGFGYHPLDSPFPLLLAQLSLPSALSLCMQIILSPLGQSSFFAQMLVGLILGPTTFGAGKSPADKLYPQEGAYMNKTFSFFGLTLYIFLIGVKMDLSILHRSGKKALAIGCGCFIVPIVMNGIAAFVLSQQIQMRPNLKDSLVFISSIQSLSSYHVVASVLADLNILNSELGRLAASSSMVSGCCAWLWAIIGFSGMQGKKKQTDSGIWPTVSALTLILIVVIIFRPIFTQMVKTTPEGKPISERNVTYVFIMILLVTFYSEVIGRHFIFGPMILGVAVPDGPPLGSAIVAKLESLVSWIFLPTYFVYSGALVNLSALEWETVKIVGILYMCSFFGKVLGTMLPSLYSKMSVVDAFTLGLIMSVQGVTDVLLLQQSSNLKMVDDDTFCVLSLGMITLTGIITPMVKILYKPSKQYLHCKKRTIQHANSLELGLKLLACIHHSESTPSMINLLKVSYPTPKSPISFYVLHLLELTGRSTPFLFHHRDAKNSQMQSNYSHHIIKAFSLYEKESKGVLLNIYTEMAPYSSMHFEICQLALDKRCDMVIVPFHIISTMHGSDELPNPVRNVNKQFLRVAPCSVGILIDRGTLLDTNINHEDDNKKTFKYSIGVIFLEGCDDREALAYAMRMGQHPEVKLTVVRLVDENNEKGYSYSIGLDDAIIKDCKIGLGTSSCAYEEEVVSDIFGIVGAIKKYENCFDLLMVGKRHEKETCLQDGLKEWSEFPELGYVGDLLASSDSTCVKSVLVVQQQYIDDGKV